LSAVSSFVGPIPIRTYAGAEGKGAVLLYHGLRSSMASLHREAEHIAKTGLTAVLVDAPHHGARHTEVVGTMPNALELPGHYVVLRLVREARDEVPMLVDHLLAHGHPKVAVAGVSFGGFIALAAATKEPRLGAIASIMGSPDWSPRDVPVPPDLEHVVAESPLARHDAFPPRPLLMLNGALDDNVRPHGARHLADKLRPLYANGQDERLVHVEYPDATHFPSDGVWTNMWNRTARFLYDALA